MISSRLRIALVSTYYSAGMGYTENLLPRALAARGHDVCVFTSTVNVYGNTPGYRDTYESFLGPAFMEPGLYIEDGVPVQRVAHSVVAGYIATPGLTGAVRAFKPNVVHSTAVVSFQAYGLACGRLLGGYRLFTECHQHRSVVKPYLSEGASAPLRKLGFYVTRTIPGRAVAFASELCYAISPDCLEVARELYGVPPGKLVLQPLGADTEHFRPDSSVAGLKRRDHLRRSWGVSASEILFVYTGRLSQQKNPALLARAIAVARGMGLPVRAMFVGDGEQREEIERTAGCSIHMFVPNRALPELYRACDVGVWPREESMSMLDAASCGLPVVASDRIGDRQRVLGCGWLFEHDSVTDLVRVLEAACVAEARSALALAARRKILDSYSWRSIAERVETDYVASLDKHA